MKIFKKIEDTNAVPKQEKLSKSMYEFIGLQYGSNSGNQSTPAQLVVDCLVDLLLGEDSEVYPYITTGLWNTVVLDKILRKYSKPYRDYVKKKKNR